MKIIIKTNIDAYRQVSWPVLTFVPRIGETVQIHPGSQSLWESKELPFVLTVTSVNYTVHAVEVDLWLNELQTKVYGKTILG